MIECTHFAFFFADFVRQRVRVSKQNWEILSQETQLKRRKEDQ